jgi:hypothetical protein
VNNERPLWHVVVHPDHRGRLLREGAGQLGRLRTMIRMQGKGRNYEAAYANLPDGTQLPAERKRRWGGGIDFIFDRQLPADTQIVLTLRENARLPPDDRQWWEKE